MKDSMALLLLLVVIASLHAFKIKRTPAAYTFTNKNVKKAKPGSTSREANMPVLYISSPKVTQNNFPND